MVGTARLDRVPAIGTVLVSDKDLKARGRSEFEEYEGTLGDDSSVRICRWVDNNMVTLIYTMGSAQPQGEILRWVKTGPNTNQQRIAVKCPSVVKLYNKGMGGVDKMDSLIGFYRIFFRSKKWYKRIFWHLVDMSLCNAWLLYRRDWDASGQVRGHLSLYDFKMNVSYCLRKQNKPFNRAGRPAAGTQRRAAPNVGRDAPPSPRRRGHYRVGLRSLPPLASRHDQIGHFSVQHPRRGRCKNSDCNAIGLSFCIKCQVYLCTTRGKQCFLEFHGVEYDVASLN